MTFSTGIILGSGVGGSTEIFLTESLLSVGFCLLSLLFIAGQIKEQVISHAAEIALVRSLGYIHATVRMS